jgi:hypothetical protein
MQTSSTRVSGQAAALELSSAPSNLMCFWHRAARVRCRWISQTLYLRKPNMTIVFEDGVVLEALRDGFKSTGLGFLMGAHRLQGLALEGYGATVKMWRDDYANKEVCWCRSACAQDLVVCRSVLHRTIRSSKRLYSARPPQVPSHTFRTNLPYKKSHLFACGNW